MASSNRGIQIGSAWFQRKINLRPQHRGVHLVTEEILRQIPELSQFSVGLCHVQSKCEAASISSLFCDCLFDRVKVENVREIITNRNDSVSNVKFVDADTVSFGALFPSICHD